MVDSHKLTWDNRERVQELDDLRIKAQKHWGAG